MKSVEQTIFEMLTENTGSHMLDSGGGNGRHWQRNSNKTIEDFENEPQEKFHVCKSDGSLSRTVSVFHYLSGLETDEICEQFNNINTESDNWDCPFMYGVSDKASKWLHNNFDIVHGDTLNTYNWDSDLSQVLQYHYIEIDGESYYVVQIHNGADVRGGYTDARLFKASEFQGGINNYINDYMCSEEIENEIKEGYITELFDWITDEPVAVDEILSTI